MSTKVRSVSAPRQVADGPNKNCSLGQRGATVVEAAIVLPIMLMAIFAVVEYGFLFKDWLTVGHAAREGVRVGATLGDDRFANIELLDTVAETMGTAAIADPGMQVRIYNPATGVFDTYAFNPSSSICKGAGDCCLWTPCPDPSPEYVASGDYTAPTWLPSSRDISAPVTDRIGVRISYFHTYITGLIPGPNDLTIAVEYQVEPQVFS